MSVPASNLTRSALVSLLTCVLGTALAVAVNFATSGDASLFAWIAVVLLTLLSALLTLLVRTPTVPDRTGHWQPWPPAGYGPQAGHGPQPGHGPPGGHQPPGYAPQYGYYRGARQRTVSWAVVLFTIVLITGLTSGVAYGGWYLTGWIIGTETGPDVLVGEVSRAQGPLTVTVRKVEATKHFTKVHLTATNEGAEPIDLPLGFCQFNDGATTKSANWFASDFEQTVAPGAPNVGVIAFSGRPAAGASTATLTFAHVGSLVIRSFTVPGIRLSVNQ